MAGCLLATATTAFGQAISPATLQRLAQNRTQAENEVREIVGLQAAPTVITLPALPTPLELSQLEVQAEQLANQPFLPAWLTQAVEQGMTKLQKLRASSGTMSVTAKKPCCEVVEPGMVKGSGATDDLQCFKGIVVRVQAVGSHTLPTTSCMPSTLFRHLAQQLPCCGIKDFVQLNTTTTPPCCCAKACTCCETCCNVKALFGKAQTATFKACTIEQGCSSGIVTGIQLKDPKERAIELRLQQPISLNLRNVPLRQAIKDLSIHTGLQIAVNTAALQNERINIDTPVTIAVEAIPLRAALAIMLAPLKLSCAIENQVLQITSERRVANGTRESASPGTVQLTPVASGSGWTMTPAAPPVHSLPRFESPDLEVHCEKMTHRGDTVVFEGNVMLLSKKHAQPIRINAHRVILNVKDGSYTVESARQIAPLPPTVSSFGVLRTSAVTMDRQTSAICDKMEPEPLARMLMRWIEGGKADEAVRLLLHMKPSQTSMVLAELTNTDPTVTTKLLEGMQHAQRRTMKSTPACADDMRCDRPDHTQRPGYAVRVAPTAPSGISVDLAYPHTFQVPIPPGNPKVEPVPTSPR